MSTGLFSLVVAEPKAKFKKQGWHEDSEGELRWTEGRIEIEDAGGIALYFSGVKFATIEPIGDNLFRGCHNTSEMKNRTMLYCGMHIREVINHLNFLVIALEEHDRKAFEEEKVRLKLAKCNSWRDYFESLISEYSYATINDFVEDALPAYPL